MGRLEFSEQFKQDAVDLVLRQSYTVTKITRALGIGETARRLSKIGSERRLDLNRAGIGRTTLVLTCRSGPGAPRALPGPASLT